METQNRYSTTPHKFKPRTDISSCPQTKLIVMTLSYKVRCSRGPIKCGSKIIIFWYPSWISSRLGLIRRLCRNSCSRLEMIKLLISNKTRFFCRFKTVTNSRSRYHLRLLEMPIKLCRWLKCFQQMNTRLVNLSFCFPMIKNHPEFNTFKSRRQMMLQMDLSFQQSSKL